MQPFFRYFGGKWKLAKRYGRPRCEHVIEPFAGAAGYSVYWEPRKVTLIEQNPVVYGVWNFLKRVSPAEVMRLPSNISHVDELPSRVSQEAKWLIGFWFNNGLTKPAVSRSNWAQKPSRAASFWSESIKRRIASQVDHIRNGKSLRGLTKMLPTSKLIGTLTRRTITPPVAFTLVTTLTDRRWRNGAKVASVGVRFARMTAPRGYHSSPARFCRHIKGAAIRLRRCTKALTGRSGGRAYEKTN